MILECKRTYLKEFIFSKFVGSKPHRDKTEFNFSRVAGPERYSDKSHALKRVHLAKLRAKDYRVIQTQMSLVSFSKVAG